MRLRLERHFHNPVALGQMRRSKPCSKKKLRRGATRSLKRTFCRPRLLGGTQDQGLCGSSQKKLQLRPSLGSHNHRCAEHDPHSGSDSVGVLQVEALHVNAEGDSCIPSRLTRGCVRDTKGECLHCLVQVCLAKGPATSSPEKH